MAPRRGWEVVPYRQGPTLEFSKFKQVNRRFSLPSAWSKTDFLYKQQSDRSEWLLKQLNSSRNIERILLNRLNRLERILSYRRTRDYFYS